MGFGSGGIQTRVLVIAFVACVGMIALGAAALGLEDWIDESTTQQVFGVDISLDVSAGLWDVCTDITYIPKNCSTWDSLSNLGVVKDASDLHTARIFSIIAVALAGLTLVLLAITYKTYGRYPYPLATTVTSLASGVCAAVGAATWETFIDDNVDGLTSLPIAIDRTNGGGYACMAAAAAFAIGAIPLAFFYMFGFSGLISSDYYDEYGEAYDEALMEGFIEDEETGRGRSRSRSRGPSRAGSRRGSVNSTGGGAVKTAKDFSSSQKSKPAAGSSGERRKKLTKKPSARF